LHPTFPKPVDVAADKMVEREQEIIVICKYILYLTINSVLLKASGFVFQSNIQHVTVPASPNSYIFETEI
jgi:hypothetical protein